MTTKLSATELLSLLTAVFQPRQGEKDLTFLVDLPDAQLPDNPAWKDRRRIAIEWYAALFTAIRGVPFRAINYCTYPNVGTNNGDLPGTVTVVDRCSVEGSDRSRSEAPLVEVLKESSVVLAMTEYSATAPLKVLARTLGFRGATMPGFERQMTPALNLDFEKVSQRVGCIKERMDRAQQATITLTCSGRKYKLFCDLRNAQAHASTGLMREPGTVANLPSGEAYVVPFEGGSEKGGSLTAGFLPVQFGDEIVIFRVEKNRATEVQGQGPQAVRQRQLLESEPAYGNIAELGIGVLGEWGVQAVGKTLLDEKLGLHIAFGRSDHLGGITGPSSFNSPQNVVHIDWVYVPSCQPLIQAEEVMFYYEGKKGECIIKSGKIVI